MSLVIGTFTVLLIERLSGVHSKEPSAAK